MQYKEGKEERERERGREYFQIYHFEYGLKMQQ